MLVAKDEELTQKSALIEDLNEQIRDLMFFIDTQNKIDQSSMKEELQSGTLVLEEAPTCPAPSPNRKSIRRKKK